MLQIKIFEQASKQIISVMLITSSLKKKCTEASCSEGTHAICSNQAISIPAVGCQPSINKLPSSYMIKIVLGKNLLPDKL